MSGSDRPAKRSKVDRGKDDYMRGNIIEIELSNFMTYSHLKCKPGPRLNLVIGPNGSGKSSIVCAIALGLAGDPQVLGRASTVGAYVKRGEESGFVRISLRGDTQDDQIDLRRKIDTSNKSEWWLNGRAVTKKDIIEVIQRFNIQVDNLTQFLPQDRVSQFAKLTPVDLLRETEKAVGDPQLPIQHDRLIQKSDELGRLRNAIDRIRGTLNQEKALNAELESDVERVRQRDELLAKADLMKKKVPWLKYDMEKAKYMEAKRLKSVAQKKSDEAEKILNDLKDPIDKLKKVKAASDNKLKDASNALDDIARRCSKLQEDDFFQARKVKSKYIEMDDMMRQEESRQQRILKAKEELSAAESELANLPLYEPPMEELGRLQTQIVQLDTDAAELRQQKSDIERQSAQKKMTLRTLTDRIKDKENKKHQLLDALRQSGVEKIFEAYRWVQENRNQLNKEVYGPVLLEVSVSDQHHADYLEGQVSNYIWKSLITQDAGDRDFLVRNMRSYDIPVLNYVPVEDHRRPPQFSDGMRGVGIYSRLDQVFDAPAAVKEVLISQSNLDNSFIGSKEADRRADEVPRLGIHDLWTPEKHYRWNRSRYSDYTSASVKAVAKSRLLLCDRSEELESLFAKKTILEVEISNLDETCKELQTRQREVENKAAELQKHREEIIKNTALHKNKQKEIINRVELKKNRLRAMEDEDGRTPIAKLTDEIAKLNLKRLNIAMEMKNLLMESIQLKCRVCENQLSVIEISSKIKESEDSFKEHKKLALEASKELQKCTQEMGCCRTQLAEAKRQAESIATITPDLEKAFLEMPSTIEELDDAIQDKVTEANSILFLNQNVLADYERRQKQIEALSKKLEEDEKQIETCMDEVNQLKGSWLPTLRSLVSEINRTFGRNFQEMAVAGEVVLDEHETDFRAYGILIRVQFRATGQLQVLSAHHQSGGERSVSTILYLVSLQDLTNCPFRVVDEINQGMDPVNERKMFQQLVRASSQPNTPQCFLLTPKLLPDLDYSKACSILNIMNGPWIEQPSTVWKSGESWTSVTNILAQQGQS